MARMKFICDAERCIECNGCVTACKNEHEVPWGVNRRRVVTLNDGVPGEKSISVACMHCSDAPCMAVCPVNCFYKTDEGVVLHDKDVCIGCGYCVKGCPFNIPRISKTDAKAYKCTLCSDRVVVGQAPACAKACPTQAIVFGSKADMIAHANKRITDLKSRGFNNAGLYDPPGVGGTHVMYVLHHNDKPSLYSGLPDNPRISPLIGVWKGVMKPLSLAAIAFAGVFGLMHYVTKGPNRVSEHDEEEATKLEKTKGA